mgnify:FL=1
MSKLNVLLAKAVAAKEALKQAKEQEKNVTEELKLILDQEGISKDTIDGIKVNYTTCTKSSINEDKLLAIVKQLAQEQPELLSCIETKEVINENTLEELMYQGFITPGDIQAAYEEKQYKTLKLKRVK